MMDESMRILTVRQPWAWAIVHGGKDVENRTRNVVGGYRGPVAIHAGLAWDRMWPEDGPLEDAMLDEMHRLRHRKPWPWNEHRGAIIGVVDLVDVHAGWIEGNRTCSAWADRYADHAGLHHLVLENPRALAAPIPYRGALWLQKAAAEVEARILAAIA